jgi:hypothetical protein
METSSTVSIDSVFFKPVDSTAANIIHDVERRLRQITYDRWAESRPSVGPGSQIATGPAYGRLQSWKSAAPLGRTFERGGAP